MYLKKLFAPVVGLIVAGVVSAVQKLVLANLSPRKRGAGIRFAPGRVNHSLHPQLKEVTMGILKKLVASVVGLKPAGFWSAAKMQSLPCRSASTRRFARIRPPTTWCALLPSSAWQRPTSGWQSWS